MATVEKVQSKLLLYFALQDRREEKLAQMELLKNKTKTPFRFQSFDEAKEFAEELEVSKEAIQEVRKDYNACLKNERAVAREISILLPVENAWIKIQVGQSEYLVKGFTNKFGDKDIVITMIT